MKELSKRERNSLVSNLRKNIKRDYYTTNLINNGLRATLFIKDTKLTGVTLEIRLMHGDLKSELVKRHYQKSSFGRIEIEEKTERNEIKTYYNDLHKQIIEFIKEEISWN